MRWALTDDALADLQAAARVTPTAEQLADFNALAPATPTPLSVNDGVGHISVAGVLTEQPNLFAVLTGAGNTTYRSIREAVAQAEADPAVREIVLEIDSPGGEIGGLFPTLDVLENARKPMRSTVGLAASAAYAIAAVAGPIEARGLASAVGSVGVVASIRLAPGVVDVTSSDAPHKRPDVSTAEGKAIVRAELDQIAELFNDYIARGRGVDAATVRKSYGRGAVMLATKARETGMIDRISQGGSARRTGASAGMELGPNQAAAAELEAQLGGDKVPGASESQSKFAERLLSSINPSKKTAKRSPADVVADIVCGVRPPEPAVDTPETVANIVIAALRDENKNL